MADPLHIACPACGARNRVPAGRLADGPTCGSCHEPLFNGHPVELDAAAFARQLAGSDLPLLVDFWAPWCGPCRMMAPHFEQAAAALEPGMRLAKVNTDEAPELAGQHGIRSIPTLVLFHRGREVARHPGAMGAQDIVRWARARAAEATGAPSAASTSAA
jgi:thioredoxin 2